MSSAKKNILIVDDSADDIHLLMENLKEDYAILAATNGEKAITQASKEPHPDVILLDVEMPGLNGYQTCRELKNIPTLADTDIIFISAHDSTEEKMAGYEAGGSDYLIKPVNPKELHKKVKLAIRNKNKRFTDQLQKKIANEAAMTALSSAGELGVLLEFMKKSYASKGLEDLARLVVSTVAKYGLNSSVQLRGTREVITVGSIEPIPPLEEELLTKLSNAGRIIENGQRFIGNYGHASLLVKNMPEDEEKRGRLRDNLAILLEGSEGRLNALEVEKKVERMIDYTKNTLREIEALQEQQKNSSVNIMENVHSQLESHFMVYDFTDEQEEALLKLIQSGVDQSLANYEDGLEIDSMLSRIADQLNGFTQN